MVRGTKCPGPNGPRDELPRTKYLAGYKLSGCEVYVWATIRIFTYVLVAASVIQVWPINLNFRESEDVSAEDIKQITNKLKSLAYLLTWLHTVSGLIEGRKNCHQGPFS